MTEVTVRVVPAPERERTLVVEARNALTAVEIMTRALGCAFEVSAAAYDPHRGVALRLEGFGASVTSREAALLALLDGRNGAVLAKRAPDAAMKHETPDADVTEVLDDAASRDYWTRHGGACALADWPVVWRISVPPSDAPQVLERLEPERYMLDWGGGLIWAAYGRTDAARVRRSIREGHATLIKSPRAARLETCTFQPPPASIAAAQDRIKDAFDPRHRLNPRRMD
jgi:glycolate oxidase FAD binding subunit